MHLGSMAAAMPHKWAHVVVGEHGEVLEQVTYAELDRRALRLARLWRSLGVGPGDTVALCLDNESLLLEAVWAAQRSGLYYTVLNWRLAVHEVAHVVSHSGATLLLASAATAAVAEALRERTPQGLQRWVAGTDLAGHQRLEPALAALPDAALPDAALPEETEGQDLLYTSGSTGLPKGIKLALSGAPMGTAGAPMVAMMRQLYGFGSGNVYLSTAPLYHSGALRYVVMGARIGLTSVVMRRFDAALCLQAIARWRVTHVQMVPTMMVRLMKLPQALRDAADVSSLQFVFHAAAPCPPDIKRRMIEWLGPIVTEGYAATEGLGLVSCSSQEWLQRPGTVGRPLMGRVHICDDAGRELPAGEIGEVWFSGGPPFQYLHDEAQTRAARNDRGWTTVHDLGCVDAQGYLYLHGRRDDRALIGGVNVYPQEVEHLLCSHPAVADAAVVREPDDDMGECLHAHVVALDPAQPAQALADALRAHCRTHLSAIKQPKRLSVVTTLPRDPSGKLYRRRLVSAGSQVDPALPGDLTPSGGGGGAATASGRQPEGVSP